MIRPIQLIDRGTIEKITIRTFVGGNANVTMAHKLCKVSESMLMKQNTGGSLFNPQTTIIKTQVVRYQNTPKGSGCGILLVAETSTGCLLGGSAVGSPQISLEETAKQATRELLEAIKGNGCVDEYLQDQLIIYMALASGTSEFTCNGFTLHTQTAIWLAKKLCTDVEFDIMKLDEENDGAVRLLTTVSANVDLNDTTTHERIPGLHLIRCRGIGYLG
jgi:RNA 3'-terminal phosphate cyclase (ATP)